MLRSVGVNSPGKSVMEKKRKATVGKIADTDRCFCSGLPTDTGVQSGGCLVMRPRCLSRRHNTNAAVTVTVTVTVPGFRL